MDRQRVLLVEDSPGLDVTLAASRFDVERVADVADLPDRVRVAQPDVAVVPVAPGAADLIHQVRRAAAAPVRVVAAVSPEVGPVEVMRLDADEHVFLPASAAEVVMRLGGTAPAAPDPIRAMVRTLPGVVYRCEDDTDWTMRVISDEIEHISGYPASSFVDNRVRSFASIIHPDDRARVEEEVAVGLAAGGDFGCEYRLVRANDEVVWVLERGRLVEVAGGHRVLDGLLFEITDRKRAQSELRAAMAEQVAGQAVTEERGRIARELHDSVGHALSVIALQAGAARAHLTEGPEQAAAAVSTIGTVTAETLEEMEQLLSRLHDTDDTVGMQRGIGDLTTLVDRVRAAGVAVSLTIDGVERPLPPSVDTVCYRVVQEGLTNALKHAPDAPVSVSVSRTTTRIDIEVTNGASPAPSTPAAWRAGRGLKGLQERMAEVGGQISAGARGDGGFALQASLPAVAARSDGQQDVGLLQSE